MVDVSADPGFVTAIMTAVTCPMNRTVVSNVWYLLSFSVGGKPMDRLHVAILMTFLDTSKKVIKRYISWETGPIWTKRGRGQKRVTL